ncbi:MAG: hypothetical protein LBU72_02020 [Burkholderiaceae bacterium]|jgi:putative exporter of polyketide antibiotics|nr:hypothetical protein [Burkholderiaceae bacterium]
MTDALQERLAAILTGLGQGSDLALRQLPELARQYVVYGRIWYGTAFAVSTMLCAVCVGMGIRCWRRAPDRESDAFGLRMTLWCSGMVIFLVGALATVQTAVLVWFAPKAWLLQEAARLLRG